MSEALTTNTESPSARLLAKFRELFAGIDAQDNTDLQAVAEEIKRFIFDQLVKSGKVDPDKAYEVWLQESFPNPNPLDNSRSIELAKNNELITESDASIFLKANLRQLNRAYRLSMMGNYTGAHLTNEIQRLLNQEQVTLDEYRELSDKVMYVLFGSNTL